MKTEKQTTILFLAVSLLCVVGKTSEGKDSGQRDGKPNILFIVSDDHGWGDLPVDIPRVLFVDERSESEVIPAIPGKLF